MSLPALPTDWNAPESFASFAAFSSPVKRAVEPVGPGFLAHARRTLRGRTWSEDEKIQAEQNVKQVEQNDDADLGVGDEEDLEENMTRDPKQWKEQDHYQVLGLSKFRFRASEEQIRIAHRKKVLKHHPDKKAASGASGEEADNYFKCIQKAFELLLDPIKRRQFDCVDEAASAPAPNKKKMEKGDFIELWTPFFETEARFSNKRPAPALGTMKSTQKEVEDFYKFWYEFDSWRTFEYLDEDVPDDSSNRDNKRYIEKKNKSARAKRKTEDTARLRKLVDLAHENDPRMRLFKEAEKNAKAQRKWEREAGARAAAEAEKNAKEAAEKKKAEEEAAAKEARESSKKGKEALKNARKKNKRTIRGSAKDVNYFGDDSKLDSILHDVDIIVDKLDDLLLESVASKLNGNTDAASVKTVFQETSTQLAADGKLTTSSLKYFV